MEIRYFYAPVYPGGFVLATAQTAYGFTWRTDCQTDMGIA